MCIPMCWALRLSLPIFNRNRGNIAIEQATRKKLQDDYQNRLNIADADVRKLLADQRINQRQLVEVGSQPGATVFRHAA